ncbi:MAG TPA: cysteine--tRNA ligase [Moorella mulderi]|nr:cysteine--tRNA ligase [Moorella mulderi]
MFLYNTLTSRKEKFEPLEPGRVRMYVCGPTTYDFIHVGNARPLVVFDVLRRYLEHKGYQVFYVMNFTDIDDKIIRRSQEEGVPFLSVADRYIGEFFKDADALKVKRASLYPRVSQHLLEIIEAIEGLIQKGYAYVSQGDVYFSVEKFPSYGKLSKRTLEEMKAGARVEVSEAKRHPLDFALWKRAEPSEPSWRSPWGWGRPGWHIECSTMALKYLGPELDIHGGGADLIFPHHENEIAQAEALTGRPFARFWLHNGFITINREKMSKSLGNFFLVREVTSRFPPVALRFFLLSTHYRSPLDFDEEGFLAGVKGWERLRNTWFWLREVLERPRSEDDGGQSLLSRAQASYREFVEAMDDDLNTPRAIAVLHDLAREVNAFLQERPAKTPGVEKAAEIFHLMAEEVLGLLPLPGREGDSHLVEKLLEILIQIRQEARQKKDWATADSIRERLQALGIILQDTPQGTRWRTVFTPEGKWGED